MKKQGLRIFIVISAIILATPIIFYAINFKDQNISDVQNDWADFGSYINGQMTPIISLLSLIVLIYIYFLIQKLSSEENHRLFRLQRRIQAYDDLLNFMPDLSSFDLKFEQIRIILDSKFIKTDEEKISKANDNIKTILDWFTKFHFFLKNFYPRYGHLFAQDINNSTYKYLLRNSRNTLDRLQAYYKRLVTSNSENQVGGNEFAELGDLIENITKYVNFLRTELYDTSKIEKLD